MRLAVRVIAALALLAAALPARAEVQKFMNSCDGKLCPFFRASVTPPEGWVEDKEATDYFKAVMFLPKGVAFDKAPAKIYAVARYNPKKQPVADFLPDSIKDWKSRARDARITRLADMPRADGKPIFILQKFESRRLKEQGYELQAVTSDDDKDGNRFVITITLSADTEKAFKDAEAAYGAVLSAY